MSQADEKNVSEPRRSVPLDLRGVDEVIAKPYRIADLRRVADRVAAGLNNV